MFRWWTEECLFDSFLNCRGGGREGVSTCIPKQTYIPVICQDARAHVCVCLSVYVRCPEPHFSPLDPYILDTCDLFVLLCHMLGMSSIRVKFPGLLYIHARFQRGRGADPGGCGPMGNHNTIGFISNTGSEPTKTRKATKSAFNVWPPSAGQRNAILMAKPL